mmetsp:Transcript_8408/g.28854  ORF Transcript_8408/g.28854 Transcript_8408/m.28854 type:complete len:250 (+) Transcript_8408:2057-2806(+)
MLGLWLWGLEGAGQDGDLGVLDVLGHLGVRHVLVDHDPVDQLRVLDAPADLAFDLDQVQVHILPLQVRDGHDRLHAVLRHLALAPVHDLAAQGGHARVHQGLQVLLGKVELLGNRVKGLVRHLGGHLKALADPDGVHPTVKQHLRLFQEGPRKHHHSRRAVPDLVVLRPAQLHQQLADLVFHLHLLQDSRTVVGYGQVPVRALKHLVHSLGPQARAKDPSHRAGRQDVRLLGLQTLHALFGLGVLFKWC